MTFVILIQMRQSKFLGQQRPHQPREDEVFFAASQAKKAVQAFGHNKVINGTLGSLYDDQFQLVTFPSVYQTYQGLSNDVIARYASDLMAPPEFAQAMQAWLFPNTNLPHHVIATPGASGAIALAFKNTLNPGDTVLIPTPGWTPYHAISMEAGLIKQDYPLFTKQVFNVDGLEQAIRGLFQTQAKVMVVINDPANNPTGYTMTDADWLALIAMLKRCLTFGPITLLIDIAYLDFSAVVQSFPNRFQTLATLSPELMVLIAFSGSKTLTAYGMRIGALVITGAQAEDRLQLFHACSYSVRGLWSVANSGAMALFATLVHDPQRLNWLRQDLQSAQDLLRQRASLFLNEARLTTLPLYPFSEGFFVMIAVTNVHHQRSLHQALMKEHIYTVATTGGLRLALCSIATQQIQGLAQRIATIYASSLLTL